MSCALISSSRHNLVVMATFVGKLLKLAISTSPWFGFFAAFFFFYVFVATGVNNHEALLSLLFVIFFSFDVVLFFPFKKRGIMQSFAINVRFYP